MTAADVRFVIEPRREPYERVAVFLDVCSNRWDLLGPAGPAARSAAGSAADNDALPESARVLQVDREAGSA